MEVVNCMYACIYIYSRQPLSRIPAISNFHYVELFIGLFSILINFPYKSGRYLEFRYLELSLCRTIFSVPLVIFGLSPIRYLEHSDEVFE